jgi:hypothetical protein
MLRLRGDGLLVAAERMEPEGLLVVFEVSPKTSRVTSEMKTGRVRATRRGNRKRTHPTLRREFEEAFRCWLDRRRLVGDTEGAIYYIGYKHVGELVKELRDIERKHR